MINKVSLDENPEKLNQDLERYVQVALDHGAHAASIILAENIVLDERVLMKCRFPLCQSYGACMNCPPNTVSVNEMRTLVKLFKFALVFKVNYPSEHLVLGGADDTKEPTKDRLIINKIISQVESTAFYDGHYFATGFSAGSCRYRMCNNQPCQALQGEGCRFKARAHASMESVGMDVFRMSTLLGWDIYPIGTDCEAKMVPHGTRLGLVLIN